MLKKGAYVKRALARLRGPLQMAVGNPLRDEQEKALFRRLLASAGSGADGEPVAFHPRYMGGEPVLCRAGTRDINTLEEMLFHGYHLPPAMLREPEAIVDLGANIGLTTAHYAVLYPRARIVGVELDPNNFALALRNTERWKDQITMMQRAIWSGDGYVSFGGSDTNAFHVIATADESRSGSKPAQSISMPTLMRENRLSRIDYLKMDIEGGEEEILLRGDTSWLLHVNSIKVELHFTPYPVFERALSARGFRCRKDPRQPQCLVGTRA